MIYPALACMISMVALSLIGIGDQWATLHWWKGFGCGFALGSVWLLHARTGMFLSVLSFIMLGAVALGFGQYLPEESYILFSGLPLGLVLGASACFAWNWKRLRPTIVIAAKYENVKWLLRLLGE